MNRWARILSLLLLPLALLGPTAQAPAGCTVAGSDLPAALAAAQANPAKCLDIPAGTYTVAPSGGDWLQATADNLDIGGAGAGHTIVATQGVTLTNNLYLFRFLGAHQSLHDLTISIGTGYSGNKELGAVSVGDTASGTRIERVEVVSGYSYDGAKGFGVGTYRPWSINGGRQDVTIADCYIHDSPATAIGINSTHNAVLHNRVERIGASTLTHGIYLQGGYTLVDGNTFDAVSGYSIHGYKHVPNLQSGGDRIINNTSLNAGLGHILADGQPDSNGVPLNRYTVITGNILRNTDGRTPIGISAPADDALISTNVLEDVGGITAGPRAVVTGNSWRQTTSTAGTITVIQAGKQSVVSDNQIAGLGYITALNVTGAGATVRDNVITIAQGQGITIGANDAWIDGNTVEAGAGNVYQLLGFASGVTGLRITNNRLNKTDGGQIANWGNLQTRAVSGVFEGNRLLNGYLRYDQGSPSFRIVDNSGRIVAYGDTADSWERP